MGTVLVICDTFDVVPSMMEQPAAEIMANLAFQKIRQLEQAEAEGLIAGDWWVDPLISTDGRKAVVEQGYRLIQETDRIETMGQDPTLEEIFSDEGEDEDYDYEDDGVTLE